MSISITRGDSEVTTGVPSHYYIPENYGASADGTTDNTTAFVAMFLAMGAAVDQAGGKVLLRKGNYFFSGPLNVTRQVIMEGHGSYTGLPSTKLTFGVGSPGIIVHSTVSSADGGTGMGSVFRDIYLTRLYAVAAWVANTAYITKPSPYVALTTNFMVKPTRYNDILFQCTTAGTSHATTEPTWNTTIGATTSDGTVVWTAVRGPGVWMFAQCKLENCYVENFDSDGVRIKSTDITNAGVTITDAPCNCFFIQNCRITGCGGEGILVQGSNANAGEVSRTSLTANAFYGFRELSSLGNRFSMVHTDNNGTPIWIADTVTTIGTFKSPTVPNGYRYKCTARAGNFKTHGSVEPSWPTSIDATVVDNNVTWTCWQTYAGGSASVKTTTGSSTIDHFYSETGQQPLINDSHSVFTGGTPYTSIRGSSLGYGLFLSNETNVSPFDVQNTKATGGTITTSCGVNNTVARGWACADATDTWAFVKAPSGTGTGTWGLDNLASGSPAWACNAAASSKVTNSLWMPQGFYAGAGSAARYMQAATTVPPASGAHAVGERYWQSTPDGRFATEYVCVVAGTPGTWMPTGFTEMYNEVTCVGNSPDVVYIVQKMPVDGIYFARMTISACNVTDTTYAFKEWHTIFTRISGTAAYNADNQTVNMGDSTLKAQLYNGWHQANSSGDMSHGLTGLSGKTINLTVTIRQYFVART